MKCPYCSVNIDEGVRFCPMCGAQIGIGERAQPGAAEPSAPKAPGGNPYRGASVSSVEPSDTARTALILSGIGLLLTAAGLFGLVAFVMCVIGARLAARSGVGPDGRLCSQARAARVCGRIGIVLGVLKLAAVAFVMGMMWRMIRVTGFPDSLEELFRMFAWQFQRNFGEMFNTLALI